MAAIPNTGNWRNKSTETGVSECKLLGIQVLLTADWKGCCMLQWIRLLFVSSVLCSFFAQSQTQIKPTAEARLPVKRVVLYKNGVGYFEHVGGVRDNQSVGIDFTTAQLNDVLKSLTVLDLSNGRVTGVSYNSTAPLSNRLSTLRLPVGEKTTVSEFLEAVRGAHVEVHSGPAVATGRLLSVEQKQRTKGDEVLEQYAQLSLVTDGGEVRTFDITPATSVRLLDHELNQEVGRYLSLVASTRDQDLRRMNISIAGTGERKLFVSYISEVPVWKSTYRIVLPTDTKAKPLLQGWAIVDNTVGEDWNSVELSLIAGAPQSFVQEISRPYYARRPVVAIPEAAMLTPQTHEAAFDRMSSMNAAPGPPPPPVAAVNGGVVGGVVCGIGSGSGGGVGAGRGGGIGGGSFKLGAGTVGKLREEQVAVAESQDLGDLFEYNLKEPVTIRKNQSALVPILHSRIEAEKVSLWNDRVGRAVRALWITNSSGLTLDAGTFNVLEQETFSGEGLMDAIKPGERRLLSYAADLGVRVESKRESESQRMRHVRIDRGVLIETIEEREHKTYTVRNEDSLPRTIVIEHPARSGWKLVDGSPAPDETSMSLHRFRVTVESKQSAKLAVDEVHPLSTRYELANITSDQIAFLLKQRTPNPELEKALMGVAAKKNDIAVLDARLGALESEQKNIFDDQQRLRENMKALKGSAEERSLLQRYTRQLNEEEDKLESLRRSASDLQENRRKLVAEMNQMIEGLSLDVNL